MSVTSQHVTPIDVFDNADDAFDFLQFDEDMLVDILSAEPHPIYLEEDEEYFINHFRDVTADELSAGFETKLWKSTVMQACDRCEPIRLLVVSAGAFSIARARNSQNEEQARRDALHPYGLQKYGEALLALQELVSDSRDCIEMALVSAVLIFCIENLAGDFDRAVQQFQSVTPPLVRRITANPKSYYFLRVKALGTRSIGIIDDALLSTFMRFDKLVMKSDPRVPSPAGASDNQNIFMALFGEGQYTCTYFSAERMLTITERLRLPESFESIAEARVYLDDFAYRMCSVWLPNTEIIHYGSAVPGTRQYTALPRAVITWWQTRSSIPFKNTKVLARVAEWHEKFMPLLEHSMTPAGDTNFVAAATLHIEMLVFRVLLCGYYVNAQVQTQTTFEMIETMLLFAARLVEHPRYHKGFVFDAGILPPLIMTLVLWPDRSVKERILNIMRSTIPRRDGVWDSTILVSIAEQYLEEIDSQPMVDPMLL
jgi:hypothetical protein